MSPKETQTFGPVPVRLGSGESTFFAQGAFEPVDEQAMPRQEVSGEVHLEDECNDG